MNIFISFSGGRTSAVMAKLLHEHYPQANIVTVFANTGEEHPATLDFVNRCDQEFGWGVVWIEAVVHYGERKACTHQIVDYQSASRKGEPYEATIKKYGIPGPASPHQCTRELKLNPMKSLAKSLNWDNGLNAVGIRADEMDRVLPKEKRGVLSSSLITWYPMVEWGITKQQVNSEVGTWPFDLEIPNDAYGNCVWCWKKSLRKLMTVAKNNPEFFDFPRRMEKYKQVGPSDKDRFFFREHRTADDIISLSKQTFSEYRDDMQTDMFSGIDIGEGCSESCEVGADDNYGDEEKERKVS